MWHGSRWNWLVGLVVALSSVGLPGSARADDQLDRETILKRLDELEQEVRVLKRQLEVSKENTETNAKDTAVVTAGKDGFAIQSADKEFQLKIGVYGQVDGRFFLDNEPASSTFVLRKARPIFEGTLWKDYAFRLMPDFGNGTTVLQDAYLDVNYWREAKARIGKFKSPFGLERLQSDPISPFMEPGLTTNLVPNRDVGAQLFGDLLDDRITYAIGVFNGVADGGSADTDADDDKDVVGRVFTQPFKDSAGPLQGLGVGVAASLGHRDGAPASYRTAGQQTFFSYQSNVNADGRHLRFSPQGYYYWGPFGLLAEFVTSTQRLRRAGVTTEVDHAAWQLAASYVLTGEEASYKGVKLRQPFSLKHHTWGALEAVGRLSELVIDKDAFATLAAPSASAQRAQAWDLGLNWYVNKNLKWALDYEQTHFNGGSNGADRDNEQAMLTRWQVIY